MSVLIFVLVTFGLRDGSLMATLLGKSKSSCSPHVLLIVLIFCAVISLDHGVSIGILNCIVTFPGPSLVY